MLSASLGVSSIPVGMTYTKETHGDFELRVCKNLINSAGNEQVFYNVIQ